MPNAAAEPLVAKEEGGAVIDDAPSSDEALMTAWSTPSLSLMETMILGRRGRGRGSPTQMMMTTTTTRASIARDGKATMRFHSSEKELCHVHSGDDRGEWNDPFLPEHNPILLAHGRSDAIPTAAAPSTMATTDGARRPPEPPTSTSSGSHVLAPFAPPRARRENIPAGKRRKRMPPPHCWRRRTARRAWCA